MLPDEIGEQEYLLRAVVPCQWVNEDGGRPSSAAFSPSTEGCSVDRDGGRSLDEAAAFLRSQRDGHANDRIAAVQKKICDENEVFTKYSPLPNNIYHSDLYDSIKLDRISKKKARQLARLCKEVNLSSS
jgi:hypothetical protein